MNHDRMGTLLRVRGIVERRRQAEQADATRALATAEAAYATTLDTRAAVDLPFGATLGPAELTALRCSAIALDDAVTHSRMERTAASRQLAVAEQRTVAAAVERRSAERLAERRAAAVAAEQDKVATRRADDIALQVWRTR